MIFYFAPLEGLTGFVYRRAHAAVFGGADAYFTPFYAPTERGLSKKDLASLAEEERAITVPQLLTRRPSDFLTAAVQLHKLGFSTVNLNCGCPSGTVSAKYKGAGFLRDLAGMRAFFDTVFDSLDTVAPGMRVSVKTRIGYGAEEEFPDILAVYRDYPIAELIIHPRLRLDFYRGRPRLGSYENATKQTDLPLCYNGDVFSASDYQSILDRFPQTDRIMLGRGAVANPALFHILRGMPPQDARDRLQEMHALILEENRRRMGDGRNLLCRMADLWNYQIFLFADGAQALRRIRSARDLAEYRAAVATLFREHTFLPYGAFVPPAGKQL